jgi:uncharacterized protein YbjT (DUF2867 family)
MILITGASGNVGSEVLKQAVAARLELRSDINRQTKPTAHPVVWRR